ncbi:uncharacterized protein PV06_11101 [Exophiala oligosperma]|uniref:JmjC domain-containing protein n=1 Tax=Exophiala oligosperma TaxID=215243 RepID=A0A0D2A8N9_9EURO|nr:uncharacterized protein PV06_11101 [Exophiala oligosperma]KIW36686.1 hypothetical protein PV06_11101 [Exophiala oligosperma]
MSMVTISAVKLNTVDPTSQNDVFLLTHLQYLSCGNSRRLVQAHRNIRTAVEYLKGQRRPRNFVKATWDRALAIFPQAFIFLSASFTHHHLLRKGQYACQQLIDLPKRDQNIINQHPGLSALSAQYLDDLKQLVEADLPHNPERTGRLCRRAPETETNSSTQNILSDPSETLIHNDKPNVSSWLDYFRNEPAFLIHLDPEFDLSKLRLLASATDDLQALWRSHTTRLPTIVPAAACWRGLQPSFEQLWVESMKIKTHDLRVYEQGEQSANAALAFCQLARPNQNNPIYIIGMEPPALIRHRTFGGCAQLHQRVTTYLEQRMVFNMTPKFSFVDLHIDYGKDGISATLHDCEKVWMIYPPKPHNLQWMAEHRGQQAKLAQGMGVLEGGVVAHTTSAEAIYLPAGCLHAVFTVAGGFLVSIDCTTRRSVWPFAQYLRYNIQAELEATEERNCYFLFLDSLEAALQNAGERDAFRAWIEVEDILQIKRENDRGWVRAARKVWDDYLKVDPIIDIECPCHGAVSSFFLEHFRDRHLRWLFNDSAENPTVANPSAGSGSRNIRRKCVTEKKRITRKWMTRRLGSSKAMTWVFAMDSYI